jgi:hypothetical protein
MTFNMKSELLIFHKSSLAKLMYKCTMKRQIIHTLIFLNVSLHEKKLVGSVTNFHMIICLDFRVHVHDISPAAQP